MLDTKAPSDRSMTLMHYLAKVLRDNYPDLLNFVHEVTYLEKAAPGIVVLCEILFVLYYISSMNKI